MIIDQRVRTQSTGWVNLTPNDLSDHSDLVIIFASRAILHSGILEEIKSSFNTKAVIGCTTAGEIYDDNVTDEYLILNAIKFEKSKVVSHDIEISSPENSKQAGYDLIKKFDPDGLRHVFVLSEGLNVNGSLLVEGMKNAIPPNVNITGGLAGDSNLFEETLIIDNNFAARKNIISAIGFYGESLQFGFGSMGGWDSFGTERLVTKSKMNVLYELDNIPALEIYKSYLGSEADNLPASGLLFPLSMRNEVDKKPLVRTILGINENDQSLTFAGNIPEGSYVRLMKANLDRLIDGAYSAAMNSLNPIDKIIPDIAILISCVGRKLVLKQMVEEEVDAVKSVFEHKPIITGFYSYGEISPFSNDVSCELHNQTMTITAIKEL